VLADVVNRMRNIAVRKRNVRSRLLLIKVAFFVFSHRAAPISKCMLEWIDQPSMLDNKCIGTGPQRSGHSDRSYTLARWFPYCGYTVR